MNRDLRSGRSNLRSSAGGCATALLALALSMGAFSGLAEAQPAVSISGTVTVAGTGVPIAGVSVWVISSTGSYADFVTTSASGLYTHVDLESGTYYVLTENPFGYVDELFDNLPCTGSACAPQAGTAVSVTEEDPAVGIDFDLAVGGTISGTVTTAGPAAPLSDVWVYVYNSSGSFVAFAITNEAGEYMSPGLPAGDYYVKTENFLGYTDELYNDLPCPGGNCDVTTGSVLSVTAGESLNGIDFGLKKTARGDFTGDGKSDMLWRHATLGEVWLWQMDGTAKTDENFVRRVADTDWEIRGLGDQDGDGKADILWRNKTTGQIYFWPMDGSTPLDEVYVATVDPAYDIVGTGDFDGDGKSDILWRHTTLGDVWIWLMDGAMPLEQVYIDRVDPGYVVKGVGDLDANGAADIVWHHATLGEVWVWPMDGTTRLDQVWVGSVPDTGYQIQAVADFTGDGKADLVWWHTTLGEVWIWTMNGPVRDAETYVAAVPDTNYRIVSAGDYDGDGTADLLWHHATLGEVWMWLMDGTTPNSQTWVATVPDTGYRIIK